MRLLVTGGCGFIGSVFVRTVLKARPDWRVLNLDLLTYAGNPENLKDLEGDPRLSFLQADIADPKAVAGALKAFPAQAIVNFAAESHVDRSIRDASAFLRTNVEGVRILLEACRAAGVGRFLQVSTDEVYGSLGPTGRFSEESPIAPNSPYAASKACGDLLVRAWTKTHGVDAVVTRCSNNYGPYQFPEKLIPLFITNALEDRPLPVYGDGLQVRDWIHVEDHARGVLAALEKGRAGEIYNLGGDCERTNLDITRAILKGLGKPETLVKHVQDRPGHDRRYAMDAAKAVREIGFRARIPFEEGMRGTLDWYRGNRAWWERVKSGAYRKAP